MGQIRNYLVVSCKSGGQGSDTALYCRLRSNVSTYEVRKQENYGAFLVKEPSTICISYISIFN
ncbi:hypothetical protein KDI_52960 [Dictyobacter arantiisoli]|uniref:Uncharacterized protein n=1 Tax=Dictyobacter arantiisoli TaxID=2014874 RepID=A0A5A5TKD2_9CHLR|nr:hypothetical protein KDI_52960 [Dictyobacter arantiisoli]